MCHSRRPTVCCPCPGTSQHSSVWRANAGPLPPIFPLCFGTNAATCPFHRFPSSTLVWSPRSTLPLPLTPPRPSVHFPASDSAAPHQKLLRSHCHPISTRAFFFFNWLVHNDRIPPSPSHRTSSGSPPATTSTFGVDECSRPPELHPLTTDTPLG
jgi:hypothetical protein